MITNWLLDHPWATAVGFAVLVLAGPPLGVWLVRHRRAAWWLAGASLVPVAVLTLVPTGRTTPSPGCTVQWALPGLGTVELTANVLLFAVPALLATVASGRPVAVLLAGSALSAGIETVQAVALDLGRACDTTDWLCNTLGALLGVVLGRLAVAVARSARAQSWGVR